MARVSWAKAYVDLRHHPDLFGRPDCDFRLWVCLILHAKEHCPDGIIRGLTPLDMRGMFGIKGPVKAVKEALEHFVSVGWLARVEGGLHIVKFVDRQRSAGDTPEAHAARQKQYRERNQKQTTSDVTREHGVTSRGLLVVTSRDGRSDGSKSDAEAEADSEAEAEAEEAEKKRSGEIAADAAAPRPAPPAISPELLEGWPPALLAQVKDAFASTRKSGMIALGPWRAFLLSARGFTPAIRIRAAEIYLQKAYASEGKGEKYLVGIMRGEHGTSQLPMRATAPARGPGQAPPAKPIADADAFAQAELEMQAELRKGHTR